MSWLSKALDSADLRDANTEEGRTWGLGDVVNGPGLEVGGSVAWLYWGLGLDAVYGRGQALSDAPTYDETRWYVTPPKSPPRRPSRLALVLQVGPLSVWIEATWRRRK